MTQQGDSRAYKERID